MKIPYLKICAVLAMWIVIYGTGAVLSTCHGAPADSCSPASIEARDCFAASIPGSVSLYHLCRSPLNPIHCRGRCRAANTCCENRHDDDHHPNTTLTSSFPENPSPLVNDESPWNIVPGALHHFPTANRFLSIKSIPIIILKQSFLC